jgi:molybdopterin-binding protein
MVTGRGIQKAIAQSWVVAALMVCCTATICAQQNATIEISGDIPKPLTMSTADLSSMTHVSVRVATVSYQGVLLSDILKRAGVPTGSTLRGKALTTYVLVEASDGYQVVFSLGELDATVTDHQIVLADSSEGKPLPDMRTTSSVESPESFVTSVLDVFRGGPLITGEYFYKDFYSRGDDEYLSRWASEVDRMAENGWEVLGSERAPGKPFQWTVCLYRHVERRLMAISARNQLRGTISEVVLGNVMAHITVKVGENVVESMISKKSAEELKLKKGDKVVVIIKSTEVMIQKD